MACRPPNTLRLPAMFLVERGTSEGATQSWRAARSHDVWSSLANVQNKALFDLQQWMRGASQSERTRYHQMVRLDEAASGTSSEDPTFVLRELGIVVEVSVIFY